MIGPGIAASRSRRDSVNSAATRRKFDQRQAQHDGNGPELSQLEFCYLLISRDEARQMGGINPPVHVRNQFQRNVINPGQIGRRSFAQVRQFAAESARQVTARGADLLFDQMKIIQEPFGRGSDAALLLHAQSFIVVRAQDFFVGREARQEEIRTFARSDLMAMRQRRGMAFEQVNAEQLAAQRLLFRG
jgi:hypothetical protein